MGKYKDWASKEDDGTLRRAFNRGIARPAPSVLVDPAGAPLASAAHYNPPQPQPRDQLFYAPAPRPAIIQLAQGTVGGRSPLQAIDPIGTTCFIVKVDSDHGDPYERAMSQIPDGAKQAGYPAPEADAMKMTSVPQFAEMANWKPTTRFYNQVTELSSEGPFEGHRSKRDRELASR